MTEGLKAAPEGPARWRRRSLLYAIGVAAAACGVPGWALPDVLPGADADPGGCSPAPDVMAGEADRLQASWRSRLDPKALERGFGVQYWGAGYSARDLGDAAQGLLIVEPARASGEASPDGRELWFTPSEVALMRRGGRRVIAYLNVAKVEAYRDYAIDAAKASGNPPPWYAGTTGNGDALAAYWTAQWRDVLVGRLDRIIDAGYDGVMLDDLLQYHDWAVGLNDLRQIDPAGEVPGDAPGFARAMMALVEALRERADQHRCGTIFVVNNGVFIMRDAGLSLPADDREVPPYVGAIDAILGESLLTPHEQSVALDALRSDFQRFGVPVLVVEFASSRPGRAFSETVALVGDRARMLGFVPYVTRDNSFSRLEAPLTAGSASAVRKAQR